MNKSSAYVVKVLEERWDLVDDNVDVFVYFETGEKYVSTFFTLENIRSLFAKNRRTGECAGGTYFWAANMVIVQRLDEATIAASVAGLLESGEFEKVFEGPYPIDP